MAAVENCVNILNIENSSQVIASLYANINDCKLKGYNDNFSIIVDRQIKINEQTDENAQKISTKAQMDEICKVEKPKNELESSKEEQNSKQDVSIEFNEKALKDDKKSKKSINENLSINDLNVINFIDPEPTNASEIANVKELENTEIGNSELRELKSTCTDECQNIKVSIKDLTETENIESMKEPRKLDLHTPNLIYKNEEKPQDVKSETVLVDDKNKDLTLNYTGLKKIVEDTNCEIDVKQSVEKTSVSDELKENHNLIEAEKMAHKIVLHEETRNDSRDKEPNLVQSNLSPFKPLDLDKGNAELENIKMVQVITKQIVFEVKKVLEVEALDKKTLIQINLTPKELGKLIIDLTVENGKVTKLMISAQNKNTKDIIANNVLMLKSELEKSGTEVKSVEVSDSNTGASESSTQSSQKENQERQKEKYRESIHVKRIKEFAQNLGERR